MANGKSGLSPEFILRASLCREPHCASGPNWKECAESEIENLQWANDYAEKGYTAGERGVLLANWNYFPSRIDDILEHAGFDTQWSDEWIQCEDCGKLVRTSGDCYEWQPYYVMIGSSGRTTVCLDCVDWAEYLEQCEDKPDKAVMHACNPEKYGYMRLSDPAEYENGFHPGQNDNPKAILAKLTSEGYKGIVFRIPETSQFYITFETWAKPPSVESVRDYLEAESTRIELAYEKVPVSIPNPRAGERLSTVTEYYESAEMTNPEWLRLHKERAAIRDAVTLVRFAEAR